MSANFWTWFDTTAAPHLALREISFRKMFEYLDTISSLLINSAGKFK